MFFSIEEIQTIREQALEMDKHRRVSPEMLRTIYDHRLFHLFVPDELEGRMTSLTEAARIFQESARIDGNLGWLVTIGAGGGFFAAYMSNEISRRVFAHREAVIAGSGMPTGTARKVDGGYIVNGSWKYCSGSTYATTFTANAVIDSGCTDHDAGSDETSSTRVESEIRSFILHPDQVEIVEDWNAFGLRATASHTISAVEAFVPTEMTFSLTESIAYEEEAIYQYPFLPFAQVSFAAVGAGIADHFLEAAESLARQRNRSALVFDKLSECKAALEQALSIFYETVEDSWKELLQEGRLSEATEAGVTATSLAAAQAALFCGQHVFPLLGLSAAMEDTEVNRCWRDLQTACSHALLRND
ncbi:acyl-CoA dehydrogenase [Paenibacillus solani]|uniref:acyl-CoA dehydrogenase n=1 Tax=Paenibacillus solani TaxID=1705565 RepID=UPI003D2AAB0D